MVAKTPVEFARHDPMYCSAPGLFRSLAKGERQKHKLDITYEHGDGQIIRFVGFEPLDAFDMRLLQVLVALAGPNGRQLTSDSDNWIGQQLRLALDPRQYAADKGALVVTETVFCLMTTIGLTNCKGNYSAVRASLLRLSNVTVAIKSPAIEAATHLLSYAVDKRDGRIHVALNYKLTEAVLGGRHTRIDLDEVRRLKSDAACLIHQRLSAFIASGETKQVGIDTMAGYAWPTAPSSAAAMRKRRQYVRAALDEFRSLGWRCVAATRGVYQIQRPHQRSNAGQ